MSPDRKRAHHRTVDRITSMLGAVTTDPRGLTLTQLAEAVDAPVSSIQKLANGLVASGFLDERAFRYVIGPTPVVLTQRSGRPLITAIRRADLEALNRHTGAGALLVVRVGDDSVNVDKVGLSDSAEFADVARWRNPLNFTAGGRVLLAHLHEHCRREWVADHFGGDAAGAVQLLDELDVIRTDGIAVGASGSLRPDLDSVAVPIFQNDEVVAALSLAQPRSASGPTLDELSTVLRDYVLTRIGR